MPWGTVNCLIRWFTIIYYVINGAFPVLHLAKKIEILEENFGKYSPLLLLTC